MSTTYDDDKNREIEAAIKTTHGRYTNSIASLTLHSSSSAPSLSFHTSDSFISMLNEQTKKAQEQDALNLSKSLPAKSLPLVVTLLMFLLERGLSLPHYARYQPILRSKCDSFWGGLCR